MKTKRKDVGISCDLGRRLITLRGRIMLDTAVKLLMWLHALESQSLTEPIYFIFEACAGGDWVAAKFMYACIRRLLPPTVGLAKRYVHSAAIAVYAATQERFAFEGTTFAFHTSECWRTLLPQDRYTAQFHGKLTRETMLVDEELFHVLSEGFHFQYTYTARILCEAEVQITARMGANPFGIFHHVVRYSDRKKRVKSAQDKEKKK